MTKVHYRMLDVNVRSVHFATVAVACVFVWGINFGISVYAFFKIEELENELKCVKELVYDGKNVLFNIDALKAFEKSSSDVSKLI